MVRNLVLVYCSYCRFIANASPHATACRIDRIMHHLVAETAHLVLFYDAQLFEQPAARRMLMPGEPRSRALLAYPLELAMARRSMCAASLRQYSVLCLVPKARFRRCNADWKVLHPLISWFCWCACPSFLYTSRWVSMPCIWIWLIVFCS